MASFEQHVSGAVITSGVVVTPLYSAGIVDMNQSLALLAFGIIGGVLPDMDSDNSRPVQISFRILSIFLPLIAVLSLANSQSVLSILGFWAVSSLILHFVVFRSFLNMTVHRGVFHSVPMGLLLGYLFIVLFRDIMKYDELFAVLCGIFVFIGFIVHLLMDELISLNALGLSIKKSFGTALKFYDKNNLYGTGIIYLAILALIFLYPIEFDIFVEIFESFENIKL
ncbi:MAG: metal-dependent hydrolase [Campylobacterota bacterium]|nr:metal-dependent hydrolase [Campylobacterota bacterium]